MRYHAAQSPRATPASIPDQGRTRRGKRGRGHQYYLSARATPSPRARYLRDYLRPGMRSDGSRRRRPSSYRDSLTYGHLGLSYRPLARKIPLDFPRRGQVCSETVPARARPQPCRPEFFQRHARAPRARSLSVFSPMMCPGIGTQGSAGSFRGGVW